MTYVGRGIDAISNVEKLDNITFDGSTTYNLTKSSVAFTPSGKNNILVSINGVVQQGNFTVAGATIIFDFSPSSNDTCNFIMHYGTGVLNTPADDTVKTATVQDDAITTDKLANSINSAITANTAKTTNATHSGEVTGATALTIADNIVDEANLKVSNSPVNGYALTAQSGNTGGMTWAEMSGGSWELLDTKNTTSGSSVDLTYNSGNGFQSTYHTHVIMFDSIRTVVDNDVIKLMSFDTSDNTMQIYYAFEYIDTNESGSTTNPNASGTASSNPHQVNLFGDVGSGFNEGASGIMYLTGADDGGMANLFWGQVQVFTHDNKYRLHQIMGRIANNQIKQIRFYGGGGNWESGHIRLYGIKS